MSNALPNAAIRRVPVDCYPSPQKWNVASAQSTIVRYVSTSTKRITTFWAATPEQAQQARDFYDQTVGSATLTVADRLAMTLQIHYKFGAEATNAYVSV